MAKKQRKPMKPRKFGEKVTKFADKATRRRKSSGSTYVPSNAPIPD